MGQWGGVGWSRVEWGGVGWSGCRPLGEQDRPLAANSSRLLAIMKQGHVMTFLAFVVDIRRQVATLSGECLKLT